MTEPEIRSLLKCPKETKLEDHLNHLLAVVECQKREELSDILIRLDGLTPSLGQIGNDDKRVASSVHMNKMWKKYVVDTMYAIRDQALLGDSSDFLRGQITALTHAYRHFESCFNSSNNQTGDVDPHKQSRSNKS